jgi:hypothetical protein
MWRLIDNKVEQWCDNLMVWLWRVPGIKPQWVSRTTIGWWILTAAVIHLPDPKWGLFEKIFMGLIWIGFLVYEEYLCTRPVESHNVNILFVRSSGLARFLRSFVMILTILFWITDGSSDHPNLERFEDIGFLVYQFQSFCLWPTGPRGKLKLPRFSTAKTQPILASK